MGGELKLETSSLQKLWYPIEVSTLLKAYIVRIWAYNISSSKNRNFKVLFEK